MEHHDSIPSGAVDTERVTDPALAEDMARASDPHRTRASTYRTHIPPHAHSTLERDPSAFGPDAERAHRDFHIDELSAEHAEALIRIKSDWLDHGWRQGAQWQALAAQPESPTASDTHSYLRMSPEERHASFDELAMRATVNTLTALGSELLAAATSNEWPAYEGARVPSPDPRTTLRDAALQEWYRLRWIESRAP